MIDEYLDENEHFI